MHCQFRCISAILAKSNFNVYSVYLSYRLHIFSYLIELLFLYVSNFDVVDIYICLYLCSQWTVRTYVTMNAIISSFIRFQTDQKSKVNAVVYFFGVSNVFMGLLPHPCSDEPTLFIKLLKPYKSHTIASWYSILDQF